ncbi:nitrate assimilation regulatory nirA [Fusarium beomiforme]|uniref:Nitrate assimilation regulatory nirA n=1 Tax=Fusarium beomiforme TaxID=44412 RepID=A0A9P5AGR8_9HYPO|nr:nitrate assimilation regulatory nirA [Fusarium beomiforme]
MTDINSSSASDGSTASAKSVRVVPLSFRDIWKPIDNIRNLMFFIVPQVLDDVVLKDALEELIKNHLPVLGARIHPNEKTGQLEYHIPVAFDQTYELFRWSSVSIATTFEEASDLKPTSIGEKESSITCYPPIPELEAAWEPSGWPLERKYDEDDCPLLLVHLTHYTDMTVITINIPHAVADNSGLAIIVKAWMNLIRGIKPPPFFEATDGFLEGAKMKRKELHKGKGVLRLMTKREKIQVKMGFIPEMIRHKKEERRTLLLARTLVEKLQNDMNRQAAETKDAGGIAITKNDVIVALLLKLSNLHRKSPRMVTLSAPVDIRGRHTDLAKSEHYIHNALSFSTARFPISKNTPLLEIAIQSRLAINRATEQSSIDRSLAVLREMVKSGISEHICEPFEISYATTNWSAAWTDIDFSPARKSDMERDSNAPKAELVTPEPTLSPVWKVPNGVLQTPHRQRKVKCDGQRPICSRCIKSGQRCEYDTAPTESRTNALKRKQGELETQVADLQRLLTSSVPINTADSGQPSHALSSYRSATSSGTDRLGQQLSEHRELVHYLRNLPEDESIELLRRIRAVPDIDGYLASAEGGAAHAMLRPSDLRALRSTGPPADSGIEFELMARHQAVYLKIKPVNPSFLERVVEIPASASRSPPRPAAEALSSGYSYAMSNEEDERRKRARMRSPLHVSNVAGTSSAPNLATSRPSANSSVPRLARKSPSPPPRGEYCDERLRQLQIDYWTRVPLADEFAAAVLSAYLENDHLILGAFDADVLLDDLVNFRLRLCSSFLVNALMLAACQAYIAIDRRAAPLAVCFFKEAESLYRGEAAVDSISNVAAMTLFGTACEVAGRDSLGQELLSSSRHMAERLGLFGIPPDDPRAVAFRNKPPEWIKIASHTAWGTFTFITLFNYFFPIEPIRYPPTLPVPGEKPSNASSGALSLWPPQPPLRHTTKYFSTLCRLWAIGAEIALVYRNDSKVPIAERVSLAFVEAKYRGMMDWMEQLKEDLVRDGNCPLHVLILYAHFHVIVSCLFQPFTQSSPAGRLRSFRSPDSHPRAIYAASVNQLKQLMLWSNLRHRENMSIFTNPIFLVLVSALLASDERSWSSHRLYFLLCIRCCADLYVPYPIFSGLAQAFLTMAMQRSAISGHEASMLLARLKQRGLHHTAADKAIITCYSDLGLANTAPENARAHNIGRLFEDLSAFDEFTKNDDYFLLDEAGDS